MVVDACCVPPATVVHFRSNSVAVVMGDVVAVPLTLVLEALRLVKSAWTGLEITHDCIPLVTQPRSDMSPEETVAGFATRTIAGVVTCTVQEAVALNP